MRSSAPCLSNLVLLSATALLGVHATGELDQGDRFECVAKWEKSTRRYKDDAYCLLEKSKVDTLMQSIYQAEDKSEHSPKEVMVGRPSKCMATESGHSGTYRVCTELKGKHSDRVSWSSKKFLRSGCFREHGESDNVRLQTGEELPLPILELCVSQKDCAGGTSCGTRQEGGVDPDLDSDDRPLNELIHTGDDLICVWKEYQNSLQTKARACVIPVEMASKAAIARGSIYVSNKNACQKEVADGSGATTYRLCTAVHEDGRLVWSSKQHLPSECFEDNDYASEQFPDVMTIKFGSWMKCAKYMAELRAKEGGAQLIV